MLAWRALSRSAPCLRHNTLPSHRTPLRLAPRAQYHTRPPTLSARIWFKRDGTPRSRIKGLLIGSFALGSLYTTYTMMSIIQEFDTANYLLSCLVHIQRVDFDLPTVNRSDATSVLNHFRELCAAFGDIPQQMIDEFFDDVTSLAGAQVEAAHKVMGEACEEIHDILVRSKGRDPWETATEVVSALDQAIVELVDLVEDNFADDDAKFLRNRRIKDQVLKDPVTRSSDYEVVG